MTKVWRLRTECFDEENGSFLVYVPPRPLAGSWFIFNENILFYLFIAKEIELGNIKGQKAELTARHNFGQALLPNQGEGST